MRRLEPFLAAKPMVPYQLQTQSMESLNDVDIQSLALRVYISRVALVIATAAFVYDYFLSIDDEVEHIWPSRLSMVKILFFLNRYMPFVGLAGLCHVFVSFDVLDYSQDCVPMFWSFASIIFAEFFISGFILYTRLYAVWGDSLEKVPLYMFLIGALVTWSPGIYLATKFESSATVINLPVFPTGCLIDQDGRFDMLAMINLLISEIVVVLGVLLKAAQSPGSMIMKRMSNDGVWYFAVSLVATIANLIVLRTTPPEICHFLLAPQAALHSINCSRLLIRIRKVAAHTEVLYSESQGDDIVFDAFDSVSRVINSRPAQIEGRSFADQWDN